MSSLTRYFFLNTLRNFDCKFEFDFLINNEALALYQISEHFRCGLNLTLYKK